ncbi:MAG: Mov34/MPN/PAD-1 family protein [Thermoplasmatota archaeon]
MSLWKRLFGSQSPEEIDADAAPASKSRRAPKRDAAERAKPEPKRRVTKIEKSVLELFIEAAKGAHPNEFAGTLRAEGDTVTELILVPAMQGGDRFAVMPLYNLPVDFSIVGTVHSHPTPNAIPSDADKQLFRTFGHTHVIMGFPYTLATWRAYDHDARPITLEVRD